MKQNVANVKDGDPLPPRRGNRIVNRIVRMPLLKQNLNIAENNILWYFYLLTEQQAGNFLPL